MTGAHLSYGKLAVPVHCVGVAPLRGLPEIPESPIRALDSGLLACRGEHGGARPGLPRGLHRGRQPRRRRHRHDEERDPAPCARARRRRSLEGVPRLARPALPRHVPGDGGRCACAAREMPFAPVRRRGRSAATGCSRSPAATTASRSSSSSARDGASARASAAARSGLRLLKTTGSAFTLLRARRRDDAARALRPAAAHPHGHRWRYGDPADALARDPSRYVAPAQVRDVICSVFHEFVSESIQHLVHEIGQRLLERFPALDEVSFAAENHTHDPVPGSDPDADRRGLHVRVPRLRADHAHTVPLMALTTHVLDTALGRPAAGVAITLHRDGEELAARGHQRRRPHRRRRCSSSSRPASTSSASPSAPTSRRRPRAHRPAVPRRRPGPLRHRGRGRAPPRAAARLALGVQHLPGLVTGE